MKIEEIVKVCFLLQDNIKESNDEDDVFDIMMLLKNLIKRKLGAGSSNEGVDYIISEIFRLKEQGLLKKYRITIFFLIGAISGFVGEKHLERIISILFWEEILLEPARGIRGKIVDIFERVGSDSAAEALEKLMVEIKKVQYELPPEGSLIDSPEQKAQTDQDDIREALKVIRKKREYF